MFLLAVLASAALAQAAATNATPPGAVATNSTATLGEAASPAAPISQSVFVIPRSRAEGVDPFFPLSTRWDAMDTASSTNRPAPVEELAIRGFSGTAKSPLVIINNRTFGVGDEIEVVTEHGRVLIRCLEIRTKDEIVIVEAGRERHELRFRRGK